MAESLSGDLRKQLADLVFTAPFKEPDGPPVTLFILLEHQSTSSRVMRFRVLFYMVQLWDAQRQQWQRDQIPESQWRFHPIVPIVFYTGSARWEQPLSLAAIMEAPQALTRFVPSFDLLFLELKTTPPTDLRLDESPLGPLLHLMQAQDRSLDRFEQVLEEVLRRLETQTRHDLDQWRDLLYFVLLVVWHGRRPEETGTLQQAIASSYQDRVRQQEIETMSKTIAQHFIEEGEARGIAMGEARGEAMGELKGRRLLLLNQLQAKFGPLPSRIEQRVNELDVPDLDALAVKLIHADSLEALNLEPPS